MDTLDEHIKKQPTLSDASNVWMHKGKSYFYEIGREQEDGAITGQVYRMTPCEQVGSFRIEPSGKITRFPFTIK